MNLYKGILFVDNNETEYASRRMERTVKSARVPLNVNGLADYAWLNLEDKVVMWEKKQVGEALSDLDGLEEQLYRHLGNCDELGLIVQGVYTPTSKGIQTYKYTGRGFAKGHGWSYKAHERWLGLKWSLWHECGVNVVEVPTEDMLIDSLIKAFAMSYVPEHTTLKRYTVPHVTQFVKNPHVDNLIRLKGVRMGEVTAKKLVAKFGTFAGVMAASRVELIGLMGSNWTRNFEEALGR